MPGVQPKQMAGVDFQRIKARDGRDLPVWGHDAPGCRARQAGTGRGAAAWRAVDARWLLALGADGAVLASRGCLVIEPEFRGSTGYGRAHLEAGFKQWGQAMQDDLVDALQWARKRGLANDKACVMGASYGGYAATLMGLVRHPDVFPLRRGLGGSG